MKYYNPEYPEKIIDEGSNYVHPVTGVQYPRNWDKTAIPGLIEYSEPPEEERIKTEEEQKEERNNERRNQIEVLERKQTLRMMGDAIIGNQEDLALLTALRAEIAVIRAELES
jgi:hypothetical protein